MQYANVIVAIRPAEETKRRRSPEAMRELNTYEALIYTDLPALQQPEARPPRGAPLRLGGYPLASVESLDLHWGRYQEYLAQFLAERKSPRDMARRLVEAMSAGLQRLFGKAVDAGQPIRVWWSTEAAELEDFPWELVAYTDKGPIEIQSFSFVRGLPPDIPPALVPLEDDAPLHLAIMAEPAQQSTAFEDALASIPGLHVTRLNGGVREMLQEVVRSNFELLHIICDGVPSLGYDGVLYFQGAPDPELTAQELAASLRPTRTVFLGLSSTLVLNSDSIQISGHDVPSVYRAFAYLGSTDLPLPTILAPLAPAERTVAIEFWQSFYSSLAGTLSIEQAAADGRKGPAPNVLLTLYAWLMAKRRSAEPAVVDAPTRPPLPLALYLRHPQEQQFRRGRPPAAAGLDPIDAPMVLGAELEASQRLVRRLQNITGGSQSALPGLKHFLADEKVHQAHLSDKLASWTKLDKL
jgi:hypothetical protein